MTSDLTMHDIPFYDYMADYMAGGNAFRDAHGAC